MDGTLKFAVIFACYFHTYGVNGVSVDYAQLAGQYGQQRYDADIKINHQYHQTGVDTTDTDHYYNQLSMFGTPSYVSRDHDRCAYFRLKMIIRFKELSKKPFSYLLGTSYYKRTWLHILNQMCPPVVVPKCHYSRYSSINGVCNNIGHPLWGSSDIAQLRFLKPAYDNGIDSPRTKSVTGGSLPSTRDVSNAVFKPASLTVVDSSANMMHMTFGQFLSHDFIFTPKETGEGNTPIKCCTLGHRIKNRDECFPIMVSSNDHIIKEKCMNFVRSTAAVPDGQSLTDNDGLYVRSTAKVIYGREKLRKKEKPDTREQENEVTSYIDASIVYGSNEKKMRELRSFIGGQMKVKSHYRLPEGNLTCIKIDKDDYCQNAGDKRVNVVPTLGSMHWLWVVEHNRIADHLHRRHRDWDDETIFQETRKIIIAMLQHIVYKSYLPSVLGRHMMLHYNLTVPTNGYKYHPGINVGTRNSVGVAAFRFGHSQIQNEQTTSPIEKTFHRPNFLIKGTGEGYRDFTRWLAVHPAAKSDIEFVSGVRNKLFQTKDGSLDLPAVNTQRGRDHGIPGYNAWRVWAGLPRASNFDGLTRISTQNIQRLKNAYKHVDDIDLFPGGMSETHVPGGMVGPTFAVLLGTQFYNYKFGDRFWYENNIGSHVGFTTAQLNEIRKITYARIICNNIKTDKIQRDVFKVVNARTNPLVSCHNIPPINLDCW